jgi:hypothetical protein
VWAACLIASDDVFLLATNLHDRLSKHYDGESIDTNEMRADKKIRDFYTELITAMRRDCFEETKLSKEEIDPRLNW